MRYLCAVLLCMAITLVVAGCDDDGGAPLGVASVGETAAVDFTDFVQQLLAVSANDDPTDITQEFNNQFSNGEPQPVDSFLP